MHIVREPQDDSPRPTRGALLQTAAEMLVIIDTHPERAERRRKLGQLGIFGEWQQCPERYRAFLEVVLSTECIPEDAKLRLLTMGRPGPQETKSFVLNHPLLATQMLLAICESTCLAIEREQRLDAIGFRSTDVIAALVREPRRVRDAAVSRIRRCQRAMREGETITPAQCALTLA